MKERGILFSSAMVRAVLAGTKSQTRRLVTPQPVRVRDHIEPVGTREDGSVINLRVPDGWQHPRLGYTADKSATKFGHGAQWDNPFGCVGDRLWVRETFALIWPGESPPENERDNRIEYRADTNARYPGEWPDDEGSNPDCPKWRPSLHMPRWASRITLEIIGVRVERLQDISDADIRAEGTAGWVQGGGGVFAPPPGFDGAIPNADDTITVKPNRVCFASLWDSINGKRAPWSSNPWVWVVSFDRVEAERKAAE
jgi:hypothetical protein